MRHVLEAQQFDRQSLEELFQAADGLERGRDNTMTGKIMATLFYEPSTRTRLSFESAMLRLGGQVIGTENAREFSSVAKGETLEDTVRVISGYSDVIVLRHSEEGAAKRAASVSGVPVINAGDGPGQHPTQALLDLYTIKRELGGLNCLTVAMVGDLKHGRTVRSLAYLLGKYHGTRILFVSPPELRVGRDILEYLDRHEVAYSEYEKLEQVISCSDVIYQTRIQHERFSDAEQYERFRGIYRTTPWLAGCMMPDAIIMHPLPRVDEILPEVDALPQAAYFRQAHYGLLVRMALLKSVCA